MAPCFPNGLPNLGGEIEAKHFEAFIHLGSPSVRSPKTGPFPRRLDPPMDSNQDPEVWRLEDRRVGLVFVDDTLLGWLNSENTSFPFEGSS